MVSLLEREENNMKTVCKNNMCTGCMTCLDICRQVAITVQDDVQYYNAVIDEQKCVNCGLCHETCPQNLTPKMEKPVKWYQGWARDEIRMNSSSGGAAAAIAQSFVENGGYVVSCTFKEGKFVFDIARTKDELTKFAGSKYVKSNPRGVCQIIKKELKTNKVLFIGLPCQVAGLKNYIPNNLKENLYTVDLICHGTPSPKILAKILSEYGIDINKISDIKFRKNNSFFTFVDYRQLDPSGFQDEYILGFLGGLFYTENCYHCNYAKIERCSDITIGDSWGSDQPKDEIKKGISLILVQTEKGKNLLNEIGFNLLPVDLNKAVEANHQLRHPTLKTKKHEQFFALINKGKSVRKAYRSINKKIYVKQTVKRIIRREKISGGEL